MLLLTEQDWLSSESRRITSVCQVKTEKCPDREFTEMQVSLRDGVAGA